MVVLKFALKMGFAQINVKTRACSTVEPLFYDRPQNHIGVVV